MDIVLLVFGLVFFMMAERNPDAEGRPHKLSQAAGFIFMAAGIVIFLISVNSGTAQKALAAAKPPQKAALAHTAKPAGQ